MTPTLSNLRIAVRRLARSPLFTVVSVLTLAVAIGANAAVFSVVHSVLLAPLPYPDSDRLVVLWHRAPGLDIEGMNQSPALYLTYREEGGAVFTDSGMWDYDEVSVTGRGEPEQVRAARVTDGVLPLLGVRPAAGRLFSAEDDSPGTAETVLLSHAYWQERFAGDPAAVGQSVEVDGTPCQVIGVLPADLDFMDYDPALFLPFRLDRSEVFFGNFSHQGVARLAPGVTLEQAAAEMARMIPMALEKFPPPAGFSRAMLEEVGLAPQPRPLAEQVVGDVGGTLWVLLGTVGIVLLIACANVANLLLVRTESRRQGLAVRSALGAGRRRIGGELLLESALLAAAGGLLGLGLARAGLGLLVALEPRGLPRLDQIAIDPTVVVFTLGISALAAAVASALPLARMGGPQMFAALKEGGRGSSTGRERHLARNVLVAGQIALALVLMIGSGLMVRSFLALRSVDPGFADPESVLTLRLAIPEAEVADLAEAGRMHERLLGTLAALPGVTSAAAVSSVPMEGWNSNDPIFVEDFPVPEEQIPPLRRFKWISPGFFETLKTPLLAGRSVTWADVHDRAEVAVVSEAFAREYWPDDPAASIGRRIRPYPKSPWRTIVGVVADVRDAGVGEEPPALVYWPMVMEDWFEEGVYVQRSMAFVVRSPRVGTPGFLDEVRQAVWSVSPRLPLANVRTLDVVVARSMARTSFTLVMLALAAGTALLLGAIGIYGVTSYVVAQRRREIGVRMALGARPGDVSRLVLSHGLALAAVGAAAGLAVAFGATRLMSALLYGVGAADLATYSIGGAGVVLIALAASYLPARRAAGVDPIETLRWQ